MINANATVRKSEISLDELDKQLINLLQKGLPVCEQPFLAVAQSLNSSENIVLAKLQTMLASGILTRFGPMFDAACLGGAFTLAAMAVPEENFAQVTDIVNDLVFTLVPQGDNTGSLSTVPATIMDVEQRINTTKQQVGSGGIFGAQQGAGLHVVFRADLLDGGVHSESG